MKTVSRILIAVSAIALASAFFVPLWQILMWAPQYPEWLSMHIWIDNITGDVRTINALNHYIGMRHIEISMFPEFSYMKYILMAIIAVGILTAVLNSRKWLWGYMAMLIAAAVGALVDFYLWGYDYGHHLDPTAPIQIPGMAYQPPIIGTKQLLNFTAYSGPDTGGWIFVISGLIAFVIILYEWYSNRK